MANPPFESEPDRVRRKYLYRRLAMKGKTKMPARLAMKLVGPDCAYHLYSQHMPEESADGSEVEATEEDSDREKVKRSKRPIRC